MYARQPFFSRINLSDSLVPGQPVEVPWPLAPRPKLVSPESAARVLLVLQGFLLLFLEVKKVAMTHFDTTLLNDCTKVPFLCFPQTELGNTDKHSVRMSNAGEVLLYCTILINDKYSFLLFSCPPPPSDGTKASFYNKFPNFLPSFSWDLRVCNCNLPPLLLSKCTFSSPLLSAPPSSRASHDNVACKGGR